MILFNWEIYMRIDKKNIKFTFFLDGNKYIVYSLLEDVSIGENLYFAEEIKETGDYESISEDEYTKVLNEYMDYLNSVDGGDINED